MAVQVQHFDCLIPAGTAIAAPVTVAMQLGVFTVRWVELDIPSGLTGAVGFYLAASSVQVLPFAKGPTANWLILNDTDKHWDLEDQPDSGDWALVGYNLGRFDHNIYVTWGLDPVDRPGSQLLLPLSALNP